MNRDRRSRSRNTGGANPEGFGNLQGFTVILAAPARQYPYAIY